jgi:hypothetical protein
LLPDFEGSRSGPDLSPNHGLKSGPLNLIMEVAVKASQGLFSAYRRGSTVSSVIHEEEGPDV